MHSIHARFGIALVVALILATAPIVPTFPVLADDEIDLNHVGTVKRGDKEVELSADVNQSDLVCKFKIKFADGFVLTADKVESDKKGKCKVKVNMPDWRPVVGDATAKLKVETKKGEDRGKASRNFVVRDRRGA